MEPRWQHGMGWGAYEHAHGHGHACLWLGLGFRVLSRQGLFFNREVET